MPRSGALLLLAALIVLTRAIVARDSDVVIHEIHYNPLSVDTEAGDEFVELRNLGPSAVDLSGWALSGGVQFTFPDDTTIPARGYVVVVATIDAALFEDLEAAVLGPYKGLLSNSDEILVLESAAGRVINRVHYRDETPWPSLADGFGPSLEFRGDDGGNDVPARWAASLVLDGTPGRENSSRRAAAFWPTPERDLLVAKSSLWRLFRGREAPSDEPLDWTTLPFDDAEWEELPGPFGFGDEHGLTFETELNDMWFAYSTVYLRATLDLDAATIAQLDDGENILRLRGSYDDGYVAYLNGVEISRDNAGIPGTPLAHDASANSSRTGVENLALEQVADLLRVGRNVLAIQAVNHGTSSNDFFAGFELLEEEVSRPSVDDNTSPLVRGVLNELRTTAAGADSFVELLNPTEEPIDLSGYRLLSSRGQETSLPVAPALAPGERLLLDPQALGMEVPSRSTTWILLEEDGRSIVDVLDVPAHAGGTSVGRFPDGDEDVFVLSDPSRGSANRYTPDLRVVLNEIFFHPLFVEPHPDCVSSCSDRLQWLELYNTSDEIVVLDGWSLTKGLQHVFTADARIPPRGFLVVAASENEFREAHPEVDNVVGDWTGRLRHSSDTINLRDGLGNRVDHVRYGDGGPRNDEAPRDGVDDETFIGSSWPREADGSGKSIELAHANLNNRLGSAWRASVDNGGTPGAANSALGDEPTIAVGDVRHRPATPSSNESVLVTCRVSSVDAIETVEVRWSLDIEGGELHVETMQDDDGVFAATIPPQADGSIVRWQIVAHTTNGSSTLLPVSPPEAPYAAFQGPYFLHEVDNSAPPPNGAPVYRIVMTRADRVQLRGRPLSSNVLLPATFTDGDETRHLVGVRYRGESSRRELNKSFRVEFPPERPFRGIRRLNLNGSNGGVFNSQNVNEMLAMDIFRRAGEPYALEWPVTLHFREVVFRDFDTRYVRKESLDGDFLQRVFDGDDDGTFYRARNPLGSGSPSGDLAYRGEDENEYLDIYDRRSGEDRADRSDIVELTRAFDPEITPAAEFADSVEQLIDVAQWARFFAIFACMTNIDGGIWNDNGEDYFLYRIPDDSAAPNAGRWILLAWDVEETFADSSERLFRPELAAVRRFLEHPRFAALFYAEIGSLRDGAYSRDEMSLRFGHASVMYPPEDVFDVVDGLDAFITRRLGFFDENIASSLTAGAVNGEGVGALAIEVGDAWRFFRGRRAPDGAPLDWTEPLYEAEGWETGPSGFGYSDDDDLTVLADMRQRYSTVFIRRTFRAPPQASISGMTLLMDYDDAYVAYVNGIEVARSASAPPIGAIVFDDVAIGSHESTGTGGDLSADLEIVDISFVIPGLTADDNVLAIVGLNYGLDSRDFSLIPILAISTQAEGEGLAGGCGDVIHARGSRLRLEGIANPVSTRGVLVDGERAEVEFITDGRGPWGLTWSAVEDLSPDDESVEITAHHDVDALEPPIDRVVVNVRPLEGGFRTVQGDLDAETVWTQRDGPYRIGAEVTVPTGVTLRIEPGTVIYANSDSSIIVRGVLIANGTAQEPIVFRPFVCDRPWGGIAFVETGTRKGSPVHEISHCDLEGGTTARGHTGFLALVDSIISIESTTFRDIAANAIDAIDAIVSVESSTFEDVFEGVHGTDSTVTIVGSSFRRLVGDHDAIDLDGDGDTRSRIVGCVFEDGIDDGIDVGSASVDVIGNTFRNFADKAISLDGAGSLGAPSLVRNIVSSCGTGIALKDGASVDDAHHNTIVGCRLGVSLFAKDEAADGGHLVLDSTILWNNLENVALDTLSSITITFCDVGANGAENEAPVGEGNLATDPHFVDADAAEFSLRPISPCIEAGRDGTDIGAVPYEGDPPRSFVRGDTNESDRVDISDAIATLTFLFLGGPAPDCQDLMDADDDGRLNLTDGVYTLEFLFFQGAPIPPPYPNAGIDPTQDSLPCP